MCVSKLDHQWFRFGSSPIRHKAITCANADSLFSRISYFEIGMKSQIEQKHTGDV